MENYKEYLQSKEWKELRQRAIDRDGGKCSFCNCPFKEVHHVTYPKRFQEDHIDNLLCVCDKCHRRLHGIRDDDVALLETIRNRIKTETGYNGLCMSACGHPRGDDDERKFNFQFIKDKFGDYLPNLTLDNFRLRCWKGSIGWVERNAEDWDVWADIINGNDNDKNNTSFSGDSSENIILWIIKNKWGKQ